MNFFENFHKNESNNIGNAVIYTRVSDTKQVDGFSLDTQEENCIKFAESRKINVIKVFREEGKSGKNIHRKEYKNMLKYIFDNPNLVQYVIVFSISRIGRNTLDVIKFSDDLRKMKIQILSYSENITEGPMGQVLLTILSTFSELEANNIRSRNIDPQKKRALEGKWNGGKVPPFGYKNIIPPGESEKRLIIEQSEGAIVKEIFNLYTKKNGQHLIAKHLTNNGILNPRSGKIIGTSLVKSILENARLYKGLIVWNEYRNEIKLEFNESLQTYIEVLNKKGNPVTIKIKNPPEEVIIAKGIHEPLISEETYRIYQEIKEGNKFKVSTKNKGRNKFYHLTGILRCWKCGGVMDAGIQYDKIAYKCRNATRSGGALCDYNTITYTNIEDRVNRVFFAFLKLYIFVNIPSIVIDKVIKDKRLSAINNEIYELKSKAENIMSFTAERYNSMVSNKDMSIFEQQIVKNFVKKQEEEYLSILDKIKELEDKKINTKVNNKIVKEIIDYIDNIDNIEDYYYQLDRDKQIELYEIIFKSIQPVRDLSKRGKNSIDKLTFNIDFNSINFFEEDYIISIYNDKDIINSSEKIINLIGKRNDYFDILLNLLLDITYINENINLVINKSIISKDDNEEVIVNAANSFKSLINNIFKIEYGDFIDSIKKGRLN